MRAIIFAASLVTVACATTDDVQVLAGREWKLIWLEDFPSMPAGVSTPTISFDRDGRAGGNTGCNSAGGPYTLDGDQLRIGPMTTTRRACINPAGNDLERAYIAAIEATRRFRITGSELELLEASGRVVVRFVTS